MGFLSVGLVLYFQIFPNSQRDFGRFLNVALAGLLNFSQFKEKKAVLRNCYQFTKKEIGILEASLILYLSDCEDSLSGTVCL